MLVIVFIPSDAFIFQFLWVASVVVWAEWCLALRYSTCGHSSALITRASLVRPLLFSTDKLAYMLRPDPEFKFSTFPCSATSILIMPALGATLWTADLAGYLLSRWCFILNNFTPPQSDPFMGRMSIRHAVRFDSFIRGFVSPFRTFSPYQVYGLPAYRFNHSPLSGFPQHHALSRGDFSLMHFSVR